MICGNCNQAGIEWKGSYSNLSHTECPHCGGINTHNIEEKPDACYACDGTGESKVVDAECGRCEGLGYVEQVAIVGGE